MDAATTFQVLLGSFQSLFTAPSFPHFVRLTTGWVLSHRHRYITDLIVSSDATERGHFSTYHRFFSHARWQLDGLWQALAGMLIKTFLGPGRCFFSPGMTPFAGNEDCPCLARACTTIR